MFSVRALTVAFAVGVLAAAAPANAQIANTGLGGGAFDPNWSVSWTVTGSPSGVTYANGSQAQATVVTSIPSVWNPNSTDFRWIGTSFDGDLPCFVNGVFSDCSGRTPGDGVQRVAYQFSTTLLGSGPIAGAIGWDNKMIGWSVNGGTINPFLPAADFDEFGFCRTADGEFNTNDQPNCTRTFSLAGNWSRGQEFTIHMTGDGGSDGLILNLAEADPSSVPEPASMALVGLGLLGVAGAARRRRAATQR